MGRGVKVACGISVLVASMGLAPRVHAQDLAAAEALFREGKALLDGGQYDVACRKLAESQRLDPSSGTLINLAVCHEKQGKTATAWAEYLAAGRLAQTQGKPERVEEAKRKAAELEPRLSYLTIRVTGEVAGIEIRRDAAVLEASGIGSKIPVDPGKHVIAVSAPGYEGVSLEVTIGTAGDAQTLVIPELRKAAEGVAPAPPPPGVAPAGAAGKPGEGPPPVASSAEASQAEAKGGGNTLAWIIGGAGVAVAATGGVFGAMALSAYSSADQACPSHTGCSHDAIVDRNHADTRATIANIAVPLGVVGIGVSVVMLLTSGSSSSKEAPHALVEPEVGPHDARLTFRGAF